MIKIGLLKANKNNPRTLKDAKFRKLVNSVREFPEMMEKRQIVIDSWENPTILAGNMRFKALEAIGYTEVPEEWIITAEGWTEEQKREFVIKDNAHAGDWDWEALQSDWDTSQLTDWGLDVKNPAQEKDGVSQSLELKENINYIVLTTDNETDYLYMASLLDIKPVKVSEKQTGTGRIFKFVEVIDKLKNGF